MAHNTKIVNQLRALVLLTQTEEQVARTRISQARTDAVRRELTQNADNAAARSLEITEQLRAIGGVPDVVTPAIGRLSATLKDRKSTRLNSSHANISYAVFCLKQKIIISRSRF